jgi:hypothetical protein
MFKGLRVEEHCQFRENIPEVGRVDLLIDELRSCDIKIFEGKLPIQNRRWKDTVRKVVKFILSVGTGLLLALRPVAICR